MAEGVVSFLLKKLTTLLSQKYTQLQGLERDVQYIMDELESTRGFLRNAEAKQDYGILDGEQEACYKQVREVAYDMEDIVDEFLLCFAHHRGGFCSNVCRIYYYVKNFRTRHRISSKIIDIKYRVEHIVARHQRYQSNEGMAETITSHEFHQHPIRAHALLLKESDLVGIDQPKSEIISFILNDNSHLKAISVVGMGGLGKTTLVKRVYEAPDVKNIFSIHVWLTISQTFKIEDGLKDLIRQFYEDVKQPIPAGVDSMDADRLRAFVKDLLTNRRYIIVLDDLWRLDHWDSIKYVFPGDDNCGNCVLITTRITDIATSCCREFSGNVYHMKHLSENESWNLFCRKTFGDDSCPPHLKSIANNILNKCEGLPLGIVVIGGLLSLKDTIGEWDMVLRSIGTELEGNGELTTISKILLLSYNELPYYLKSCLLYMGIFPEDEIVHIEELLFLWIAEGFVKATSPMTAMEVAKTYLKKLMCRSLIQVAETNLDGRLLYCRVHDLIYEIILSKCKAHNVLTPGLTPYTEWPEKVRRLCVDDSTCPKELFRLSHLRSLFINETVSDSSFSILLNGNPKLLKVLSLLCGNITTVPNEVFKLSNLTYLNLSNTSIRNIPKSIGKLQNLEYLNIVSCNAVPADIIKLNKLRCLYVSNWIVPNILGGLYSLQYLSTIRADIKEAIWEIGKLIQLRKLYILCRSNGMELCSSLEKMTNLQQLDIEFEKNETVDLNYSFSSPLKFLYYLSLKGTLVQIPGWVTSLHGLSTVKLDGIRCGLGEDPLEYFADLPNLVDLSLLWDAYVGNTLHFKTGKFQKLKRLDLCGLTVLELVILEEGTLSDLEIFHLSNCMLVEELPGIQNLRKLRSLQLFYMSFTLENKVRNQKKDGNIDIAHITEIIVENERL